ncbi:MAG: hypothetical protein M5U18_13235 [Dehalococcoidia bacterium]|nr:hypothetical protein [Dehalococcoidia bacterium]
MTGKAPLLLASFLFGVGVTGLVITTAERAEWGPFQPQTRTPAPQEVVVVQVGPEITPPPLLELMNGIPESALAVDTSAQVQAPAPAATAAPPPPEPTPTPVSPLRVYGIASDDAGVSAAGTTPTPPPPLRIINVASDAEPRGHTGGDSIAGGNPRGPGRTTAADRLQRLRRHRRGLGR